jgi:hypothetical protein
MPVTTDDSIALPDCTVRLPRHGLGTWAWGDTSTWGMNGYDQSYGLETIREAYARALAHG